jgi:hypothetical protein
MITEISKLLETTYTVMPSDKMDPKIILELLTKIKKKKTEPFAKIYVNLFPAFLPIVLQFLNKYDLEIKNIAADNKLFVLEF